MITYGHTREESLDLMNKALDSYVIRGMGRRREGRKQEAGSKGWVGGRKRRRKEHKRGKTRQAGRLD